MDGELNQPPPTDTSNKKKGQKKRRNKRMAEKLEYRKDDTIVCWFLWIILFSM